MKRSPVTGNSVRRRVLRQRRIYTRFADAWETLRKSEPTPIRTKRSAKTMK